MGYTNPRTLNAMAVQLQGKGRCREALAAFERAAAIYESEGDVVGQARCLNGVGACYKDLGETEHALASLEQVLPLRRRAGDLLGEAVTLTTLGPLYQVSGRPKEADSVLRRALELTTALGHRNRRGQVLYNLAEVARTCGRLSQAVEWYREALATACDEPIETAKCLNGLSGAMILLGLYGEAFEYARRALDLSRTIDDVRAISTAHHHLGVLLAYAEKFDEARSHLDESVSIDMRTGAQAEASHTMQLLAGVLHRLGANAEARRVAEAALAVAESCGGAKARVCSHSALGALLLVDGCDVAGAIEHIKEALRLAQHAGDYFEQSSAMTLLARSCDMRGDRKQALALLEEAASIWDGLRTNVWIEEHRRAFFSQAQAQEVYSMYVGLLIRQSRQSHHTELAERAFSVRERSRARGLLDHLYTRGAGTADATNQQTPPLLTLAQAQQLLEDDRTAIVVYSLHLTTSYAWLLRRNHWHVADLAPAYEILRACGLVREATLSGDRAAFRTSAHTLYRLLVAPIEAQMEGLDHVIIVPDENLSLVPFGQFLRSSEDPASYLIRDVAISYAPSTSALAAIRAHVARRARQATREFLGFAPVCDGDLPSTKDEITTIASLFDPRLSCLRLGHDASRLAVASDELGAYRFIHFATHGRCDVADPNGSALLLHGDADSSHWLYAFEVSDLSLAAELVTLSACDTGIGMPSRGEGLLGLARAFLLAGAESVCATLWPVDDDAAALLMRRFYGHILDTRQPCSKAQALRLAQLDLLESRDWTAPSYWGAFVLVGDSSASTGRIRSRLPPAA